MTDSTTAAAVRGAEFMMSPGSPEEFVGAVGGGGGGPGPPGEEFSARRAAASNTKDDAMTEEFFAAGAAVGAEKAIIPHGVARHARYTRLQHDDDGDDSLFIEEGAAAEEEVGEEKEMEMPPDRSLLHLFGINSFAFAYGLLIATFGLITLPLEAERLWPEKHALLLAVFLAICGVSQLSGPVAGYFSDRGAHPSFGGRRRPFMAAAGAVGLPSLLALRAASAAENLAAYLALFLLAMLALNVMYIAYSGALTDLVNEGQRGLANGMMGALSVLGASVGFGCFSYFLDVHTGYYFYLAVLTASVIISLISYTETPLRPSTLMNQQPWTWREIGECYWISPREHRDFFLVFVSRTFYYMGISAQVFMLFYFRDVINSKDPQADVSYLALIGQLSGAAVCVPMGVWSNRVGRKALIYVSSTIIVGTYVVFMRCRSRDAVLLAGAVYGVGNGTYLSVDYALACDTLPSKENAARYLGIWGVGAFIGTLLGPMLIGPALLLFGDKGRVDEDGTPMYDIEGYVAILMIGCACISAGATVVAPIRSAR
jgi:MFS family permease